MANDKQKVPIIEGYFTWPSDEPRLLVNRCKKCGAISFPKLTFCPNPDCEKVAENIEAIELSSEGTLWTYGQQVYPPPEPFKMDPFQPFAIGMVDFPEGVRVLGMVSRTENLQIGMKVKTSVSTLYQDDENEYITWVWEPVD